MAYKGLNIGDLFTALGGGLQAYQGARQQQGQQKQNQALMLFQLMDEARRREEDVDYRNRQATQSNFWRIMGGAKDTMQRDADIARREKWRNEDWERKQEYQGQMYELMEQLAQAKADMDNVPVNLSGLFGGDLGTVPQATAGNISSFGKLLTPDGGGLGQGLTDAISSYRTAGMLPQQDPRFLEPTQASKVNITPTMGFNPYINREFTTAEPATIAPPSMNPADFLPAVQSSLSGELEAINEIRQYLSQNPNANINWQALSQQNPNLNWDIIMKEVSP